MGIHIPKPLVQILTAPLGFVFAQAIIQVCHTIGWFPENQLAALMLGIISNETARWLLIAVLTLVFWLGLDALAYRGQSVLSRSSRAIASANSAIDKAIKSARRGIGQWILPRESNAAEIGESGRGGRGDGMADKPPPVVGLPMGVATMGAAIGSKAPELPPELTLPKEIPQITPEEKVARDELGRFARNKFDPAVDSIRKMKCLLRDHFQSQIGNAKALRAAVGFGIDSNHRRCACFGAKPVSPVQWLFQADTLRYLTKKKAVEIFEPYYFDYLKDVQIAVDLVSFNAPFIPGVHAKVVEAHTIWRDANDQMIAELDRLAEDGEHDRIAYLAKSHRPAPFPELSGLIEAPLARDTPLALALGFMLTGGWSADFIDGISGGKGNDGVAVRAFSALHQAACDGEVIIWGKLSNSHPWVAIPREHWAAFELEWYSSISSTTYQGARDELINTKDAHETTRYHDLMVSRAQIEKKWPIGFKD